MGKEYKLSLIIGAQTAQASLAIRGLENQLRGLTGKSATWMNRLADGGAVAAFGALGGRMKNALLKSLAGTAIGKSLLGGLGGYALPALRIGIGGVGAALGALSTAGGAAFSVLATGAQLAAGAVRTVLGGAISIVTGGMKLMAVGAGLGAAAVYGAYKAMGPAADMQQYQMQLEVMLKSADKAKERLKYLTDFAAKTPFQLPQVIEANNLMQAFGIYSKRNLTAAGDAASAFGKDLSEVVRSINYLAGGRTGEAFESLARIGITRDKLKPLGVTFNKAGELTSGTKEAFSAVITYIEKNFGGMMARQSKTFKGAISNLGDAAWNAFAKAGAGLLRYATPAIQSISAAIEKIGNVLEGLDWAKLGGPWLAQAAEFVKLITGDLMNPKQRGAMAESFGANILGPAKGLIVGDNALIPAVLKDFGGILERFVGKIGDVFSWAWDGLGVVLRGAWAALSDIGSGFSTRIGFELGMLLERLIPGGANERVKAYESAQAQAMGEIPYGSVRNGGYKDAIKRRTEELLGYNTPATGGNAWAGTATAFSAWMDKSKTLGGGIWGPGMVNSAAALAPLRSGINAFRSDVIDPRWKQAGQSSENARVPVTSFRPSYGRGMSEDGFGRGGGGTIDGKPARQAAETTNTRLPNIDAGVAALIREVRENNRLMQAAFGSA